MWNMSKSDYYGIDGHTLKTFLTVLEEGAVTKAAGKIGVTQSAVSHTLDKLRVIFEDPLFVRDGRGIAPSAKALSLREPIEDILRGIESLSQQGGFDPTRDQVEFTILGSHTFGPHNFLWGGQYNTSLNDDVPIYGWYTGGGFLNMSGYEANSPSIWDVR